MLSHRCSRMAFVVVSFLPTGVVAQSGPQGTIPNRPYPANELYTQISPDMSPGVNHNQSHVVNGYLFISGNAHQEIWDISNPYAPVRLSAVDSPHNAGEAEGHQVSFARYPDGAGGYHLYAVTVSGRGVDLWEIDDPSSPVLLHSMLLSGINYGDNTEAVWGVSWEGDYVYVGGTNTGLHIIDASDPSNPTLVIRVPTSAFGGVSAGTVFAIGNLLVIGTPKSSAGLVTMDISDPANPVLLDTEIPSSGTSSYIGWFFGSRAYLQSPFRTYDVTTDPRNITLLGSDPTPKSEYMNFGDDLLYLGTLRKSADGLGGVLKYDISDPNNLVLLAHIPGRDDRDTDDQFTVPIGNLLVLSDEQAAGEQGSFLAPHDTDVDVLPPGVRYVNPPNGATNQALTSRVGVSFSDQIELATVDESSFFLRPSGGAAVPGKWGIVHTVVTFWPDQPLLAETTYEIVVPAGGVTDLVGNPIAATFLSSFTTGLGGGAGGACGIDPLAPTELGQTAFFDASNVDESSYTYDWDFGDGSPAGNGASTSHVYGGVGRYPITLTLTGLGDLDEQAEDGILSGGVVVAANHAGYFGTGFADYPFTAGPGVKITWNVNLPVAGSHDISIRYALRSAPNRPLNLHVNGVTIQTFDFAPTGAWTRWQELTATGVALHAGANTIELVADAGSHGPNVDQMTIHDVSDPSQVETCGATQVVHRALTVDRPTRSSTVIVDETNGRVWTANRDADTVTAVDLATWSVAFETNVGRTPSTLAQAPNGDIWVVNQSSHEITILSAASGAVLGGIALPYGSQPYGLAFAPDGSAAFVTLAALGRLAKIDPSAQRVIGTLDFGPDPNGLKPQVRGIAVTEDSARVLVTRFVSPVGHAEVYDVDADSMTLRATLLLANDPGPDTPDSGRGIPNYLSSIVISPDGVKAWMPSKKDNMDRGLFRDGQALTHDSSVRPMISQIDLTSNLEELSARMDLNDADSPFAVEVSALGDLLFVAIQGINQIDVRDAYRGQSVASLSTGLAPRGVALDSTGRLFVQNFMDRSLTAYDVSTILDGTDNTAERLALVPLVQTEPLAPEILRGKQIFYNAGDTRMSLEGYISCASCHLDGGQDGRVWDFTDRGEGFRNTITLRGRDGMGHGPVHWTGNFDEIQDFENDMRNAFGGTGFLSDADFNAGTRSDPLGDPKAGLSADLDALAAYVASLADTPDSPHRQPDGSLTPAGVAGQAIFHTLDCTTCHGGPELTDSTLDLFHDVGTIQPSSGLRRGEPLTGFDTPTLKGVWATAPYFHDGSANTLYDVIDNPLHGNASGRSQPEKDDLVAFLLQIDETLLQIDCTPPDFDCDGDVDLADYLVLQQGFSGPGVPTPDPRTDLDHDGDTDLADLVTFQAAFTGAR